MNKEEINHDYQDKTALVAALVIGSASTAFAAKSRPTPIAIAASTTYQQTAVAPQPRGELIARGQLIEGRNVGVEVQHSVPATRSTDRAFNSSTSTPDEQLGAANIFPHVVSATAAGPPRGPAVFSVASRHREARRVAVNKVVIAETFRASGAKAK